MTWTTRGPGRTYHAVAWLFLAAIVIQVFLAGYAVTADPASWAWHRAFVHVVEVFPLVLAGIAGFSKAPRRFLWFSLAAFALIWLQYLLIHMPVGVARALHPTNAIAILAWSAAHASAPMQRKDAHPSA